ncbi:fungal-specific transcription factor domain-containing protein, partial [Xylariales sp. PMI_506]
CWTCRLRRKKCDRERPTCRACSTLSIACHYGSSKPEWMDGGRKQSEMARRIQAQVRQGAEARRDRQYVQVMNLGTRTAPLPDETPASVSDTTTVTGSSSASPEVCEDCISSGHSSASDSMLLKVSDSWSSLNQLSPSSSLSDCEIDFTMGYLDYVFPFLFPFYQPQMLNGGRSWLLSLLRDNRALFHTAMSMSSRFLVLALSNGDTCHHQVCKLRVWNSVVDHADTALRSMQEEMASLRGHGSHATIAHRARVLASMVQLMVFEVAMARTTNWHVHLTAAATLLDDVLDDHKGPDGQPDIDGIMHAMDKTSYASIISDRRVWNADQMPFRFFVAVLLCADIVCATKSRRPPRLHKHLAYLIFDEVRTNNSNDALLRTEDYIGCHGWALVAVSEAAMLNAWKQDAKAAGTLSAEELSFRSDRIFESIETGMGYLDKIELTGRVTTGLEDLLRKSYRPQNARQLSEQIVATRIWAHAARIYTAIVAHGWQPEHPRIRESVGAILALFLMDPTPAGLRSLAWPFCVGGCLAVADQEDVFRHLAAASGSLCEFGAVGEALRVMESVWRLRQQVGTDWDLASCFEETGSEAL